MLVAGPGPMTKSSNSRVSPTVSELEVIHYLAQPLTSFLFSPCASLPFLKPSYLILFMELPACFNPVQAGSQDPFG